MLTMVLGLKSNVNYGMTLKYEVYIYYGTKTV